ncbi:ABC transporter permease [Dyella soli]|uniref:ABC transporter n=1 Tax=Dyella soli TaxID=522319 RepID=A0A4R0YKB0_9GAMM|nr:ABC transporter permease [Dyella soli]TCI08959.1 ABC transporter [Dyella soli]
MSSTDGTTLRDAAAIQARVIGALMMRELHTKFGRHNIGYLWALLEPMTLALGVTAIHLAISKSHVLPFGMESAPFWLTGYGSFVLFRSIVLGSMGAIAGNRGLLYHRVVTLQDMLVSRALLDGAMTTLAIMLLLGGITVVGLGHMPDRPLLMLTGLALMLWFALGASMLIAALSEWSHTFERLMHPILYLMMPISGAFYVVEWLPTRYAQIVSWIPLVQIMQIIREGEWEQFDSIYVFPAYTVFCCMVTMLSGLFALRMLRRHVEIE